jgi:hypothetical protein
MRASFVQVAAGVLAVLGTAGLLMLPTRFLSPTGTQLAPIRLPAPTRLAAVEAAPPLRAVAARLPKHRILRATRPRTTQFANLVIRPATAAVAPPRTVPVAAHETSQRRAPGRPASEHRTAPKGPNPPVPVTPVPTPTPVPAPPPAVSPAAIPVAAPVPVLVPVVQVMNDTLAPTGTACAPADQHDSGNGNGNGNGHDHAREDEGGEGPGLGNDHGHGNDDHGSRHDR